MAVGNPRTPRSSFYYIASSSNVPYRQPRHVQSSPDHALIPGQGASEESPGNAKAYSIRRLRAMLPKLALPRAC
jgi:hypothetical protein